MTGIEKLAGEPTVWRVVEIIVYIALAVAGFILALTVKNFIAVQKEMKDALVGIGNFLARQEEKNEENVAQHEVLFDKLKEEHEKVNGIEKDVLRLNIVHEKLCPVKPLERI